MHSEQYDQATKLLTKKSELISEQRIWLKKLTDPRKLAYRYSFESESSMLFENSISPGLFKNFRDSRLEEIASELAAIELEFSKI